MQSMSTRIGTIGVALLFSALIILSGLSVASAKKDEKPPKEEVRKVFVCKYVGTPGADERLKDGKNPISVASSATVGTWFNDAQGRSYVIALDEGQDAPECPAPEPPTEPDFRYNFTFDKVWEGDKIDESKVDVSLTFTYKKQTVTINEGAYAKVKKNAELTNLEETVTGLPEDCTYVTDLPESYTAFKKDKKEVELQALTENGRLPMVDTLIVTNTVECEDEPVTPVTPVTPEGEEETPVTPAGTTTQITATPTGAVDAGAGANLIASLAGLMSSAAVVAAGVFSRRFGVVSL